MRQVLILLAMLFCLLSYARMGETYEQCKERYGKDTTSKPYEDAVANYKGNVKKYGKKPADELLARFKRDLDARDEYGCYMRVFKDKDMTYEITFLNDVAVKISIIKVGASSNGKVPVRAKFTDDEFKAFMLANSKDEEWEKVPKDKGTEITTFKGIVKAVPLFSYEKFYAFMADDACIIISTDFADRVNAVNSKKAQDGKK